MSTYSILGPSLVAVVILLSLSAFFSSSESAIFSLSDDMQPATEDSTKDSRTLQQLRANPHRLLVTLLVGNNLVNIAITSIVTLLVARFVPPRIHRRDRNTLCECARPRLRGNRAEILRPRPRRVVESPCRPPNLVRRTRTEATRRVVRHRHPMADDTYRRRPTDRETISRRGLTTTPKGVAFSIDSRSNRHGRKAYTHSSGTHSVHQQAL